MKRSLLRTGTALLAIALALCGGVSASALTVQASFNDPLIEEAGQAFAGDAVKILESGQNVLQSMLSQSSAIDIYILNSSGQEYDSIFARRYMCDLSGNAAIAAFTGQLYPQIQEVVAQDGAIYGVPLALHPSEGMAYNRALLEQMNLALPATWEEYFQLLLDLPAILAGYDDVYAFEPYLTRDMVRGGLLRSFVGAYIDCVSQDGKEFRFDTEAFRTILHLFEQIDFSGLRIPEEGQSVLYEYDMANVLFAMESTSMQSGMETLLLRLEEGDSPIWPVSLEVAFVNPYSPNQEQAIAFLAEATAHIRDNTRVQMMPGENEPIPNANYQAALENYDQQIAEMEALLETAPDEEKRFVEEQLAAMREYRDDYARESQYNVTAERIAQYRQTAQFLAVKRYIGVEDTNSYLQQIAQYLAGAFSAEELIQALDTTVTMMVLESGNS